MITKAVYKFSDKNKECYVYKHLDNDPRNAAIFIQNALPLAWELPRFEADEFASAFIAANKNKPGDMRIMKKVNDYFTQFLYEVTCINRSLLIHVIHVYNIDIIFSGSLDELINFKV